MLFKEENLRICTERGIFYLLETDYSLYISCLLSVLNFSGIRFGGMCKNYQKLTSNEKQIREKEILELKEFIEDPLFEIELERYKQNETRR